LLVVFYGQLTKKVTLSNRTSILSELNRLPQKINKILKQQVDLQIWANKNFKLGNLLLLGGGYQHALALEAALKLKETTYLHAEGFAIGEFAHGPLAVADAKHPCFVMALKDDNYPQAREFIRKLKKSKIKTFALGNTGYKQLANLTERTFYIPKTLDLFNPLLGIIPIQILAYHIALLKGINPDKPRHLRKYVS
jgi:glucosamine--fructose-6-phosphate aminotransferase (isomerizing)